MKRVVAAFGLAILAGCAGQSGTTPPSEPKTVVGAPSDELDQDLQIEFRDHRVHLGESLDELKAEVPAAEGAVPVIRLPAGFMSPYEAWGWNKDGVGLGVIAYRGRIAAAMVVREKGTDDEVVRLYTALKDRDQDSQREAITGKKAAYWFWDKGVSRYVLCAITVGATERKIIEAIGDRTVLANLRLSPEKAREDIARTDSEGG